MKRLVLRPVVLAVCMVATAVFAEEVDEYTVLMLHFNGKDGSENFIDDSFGKHTVEAVDNVRLDIAQRSIGAAWGSARFDGTKGYLTIPDHHDWHFGLNDFTVDFWLRINEWPSGTVGVWNQYVDLANHQAMYFGRSGELDYIAYSDDVHIHLRTDRNALLLNQWHHVALVRSDKKFKFFVDGVQSGETTAVSEAIPNYSAPLIIGKYSYLDRHLNGWIDDFRVSTGVARWTSDFIPAFFFGEIDTLQLNQHSRRRIITITRDLIESEGLKAKYFLKFAKHTLFANRRVKNTLKQICIFDNNIPPAAIKAKAGDYVIFPEENRVELNLIDGAINSLPGPGSERTESFEHYRVSLTY